MPRRSGDPHDFVKAHAGATASYTVKVTAMLSADSSACVACHGNDLTAVLPAGNPDTGVAEHKGCSCHSYAEAGQNNGLLPAGQVGCQNCHGTAQYSAHGFGAKNVVSGHNTSIFGTVGAHSKWDGSQGPVVKDSTNATITQVWPLPTADVFWSQVDHTESSPTTDAAPATANTTVGWGSVITCEDCHTGLNVLEVAGPHGANTPANFGLDPNYPDDWTTAELTSYDPTGMRSVNTTMGSANPYYDKASTYVQDGYLADGQQLQLRDRCSHGYDRCGQQHDPGRQGC